MNDAPRRRLPRPVWIAAIGLALFTAAVVMPAGDEFESLPGSMRTLEFHAFDAPGGRIVIKEARTAAIVHEIGSGEDAFIRTTLRSLARERRGRGIGAEPPFLLSVRTDGSTWLEDPAIGARLALAAYGHTNEAAFARLLDDPRRNK